MVNKGVKTKRENIRVGGKLKEVITIYDESGHVLDKVTRSLMLEFYLRDILQVIVGASVLAVPVAFTEETWNLGQYLPGKNIFGIFLLSVIFISAFVYYNYYMGRMADHKKEFIKRVVATYVFSFIVVGVILTLIQNAPWPTDWVLALKRTILVTFPAAMSAAVADMIK